MSDGVPHYRNKILRAVAERLGVTHHFAVAHSARSNGTVGRMSRDVFGSFRVIPQRETAVMWAKILAYHEGTTPFQLMTGRISRNGMTVLACENAQG